MHGHAYAVQQFLTLVTHLLAGARGTRCSGRLAFECRNPNLLAAMCAACKALGAPNHRHSDRGLEVQPGSSNGPELSSKLHSHTRHRSCVKPRALLQS